MGEARDRQANGTYPPQTGVRRALMPTAGPVLQSKRIRVCSQVRMEVVEASRVVMLTLGDRLPELATALTAANCRKIAASLIVYADQLDRIPGQIIAPGGLPLPPPPGDGHDG